MATAFFLFGAALFEGAVERGRWPWNLVSTHTTTLIFLCTLGALVGFLCGVLSGSPAVQVPLKRRFVIGIECGARISASLIGAGLVVVVALICFMLLVEASDRTLLHGADVVLQRLAADPPLSAGAFPGLLMLLLLGTLLGGGLALLYGPAMGRYGLAVAGACVLAYMSSGTFVRAAKEDGLPRAVGVSMIIFVCLLGAAIGNSITKRMLSRPAK